MSHFEDYFDNTFKQLKPPKRELPILESGENYVLVAGDFFGIQKFIFERLSTKNAAKVLRAKSAFIQLYTDYLAKYICYALNIEESYILSITAGKFEILSQASDTEVTIKKVQQSVDSYFMEHFFGLSGVSLCCVVCQKEDFESKTEYRNLRERISNGVEENKFHKFNLIEQSDFVMHYDDGVDNQTLCDVCNIRKRIPKNDTCKICNGFIELGKKLVKKEQSVATSDDLNITMDGFNVWQKTLDAKIKSYILHQEYSKPADFETLAQNSCADLDTGIKSLAILKADVDSMGRFLRESDVTDSFENFALFSESLDNFFSLYVPSVMRKKYRNTYTVFAGGDDLFLVGAWDEILRLSREIHKEFQKFIKGKLSISFGIALAKPSHPIAHLAHYTEHLLEASKGIDAEKNAITIFGETVKWKSYKEAFDTLQKEFDTLNNDDTNTAFLYRLLDFCEMSKKVKEGNIEATMWKSKLRYSFSRNNKNLGETFFGVLDNAIEKNPSQTKIFLCEFIYKRRD